MASLSDADGDNYSHLRPSMVEYLSPYEAICESPHAGNRVTDPSKEYYNVTPEFSHQPQSSGIGAETLDSGGYIVLR